MMSNILPLTDLKDQLFEISTICHAEDKPVFLTKNGKGNLVVMSQMHYDRLLARIELYEKLGEAEMLEAAGEEGVAHGEMMKRLRQKATPPAPPCSSRLCS